MHIGLKEKNPREKEVKKQQQPGQSLPRPRPRPRDCLVLSSAAPSGPCQTLPPASAGVHGILSSPHPRNGALCPSAPSGGPIVRPRVPRPSQPRGIHDTGLPPSPCHFLESYSLEAERCFFPVAPGASKGVGEVWVMPAAIWEVDRPRQEAAGTDWCPQPLPTSAGAAVRTQCHLPATPRRGGTGDGSPVRREGGAGRTRLAEGGTLG